MYDPFFETKKNGVPIASKNMLDTAAECMLRDFCPKALDKPSAIDIDRFVERGLGMKQDFRLLSHNGLYLGMTVFNDTDKVPIYDPRTKRAEYISAEAGTMIIDARLLSDRQEHRYRFTAAHEGAHRILHSRYFAYNSDQSEISGMEREPIVQCRVDILKWPRQSSSWTDTDWMEWQANNFASALLMPRCMVYKLTDGMDAKISVFQSAACIRSVSNTFNVSLQAAEIRLKDLGITGDFKKSDIEYEMDFLPRIV